MPLAPWSLTRLPDGSRNRDRSGSPLRPRPLRRKQGTFGWLGFRQRTLFAGCPGLACRFLPFPEWTQRSAPLYCRERSDGNPVVNLVHVVVLPPRSSSLVQVCPPARRSGTKLRFDAPDVSEPCRNTIPRLDRHKLNCRTGNGDLPSPKVLATSDQMIGKPPE